MYTIDFVKLFYPKQNQEKGEKFIHKMHKYLKATKQNEQYY